MLFKHYWNALTIKISNLPPCRVVNSQPVALKALWAVTAFLSSRLYWACPIVPGAVSA